MSSEQYRTGLIAQVTNGSQIVIGTASCDWANQVTTSHTFKVDIDGEAVYQVGQVVSASRIILSSNYTGTTGTGLSYMIQKSFTSRGYWRCLQGDFDFAEILSQSTIDLIDTDIAAIDARLEDVELDAIAADVIVINASIDNLQDNMINANASIDALQSNVINANASIGTFDTSLVRATASIDALQSNVVNVNASIATLDDLSTINASIGNIQSNVVRVNASIDALQSNMVNANASIDALDSGLTNANASISAIDVTAINASITGLKSNIVNANASIDVLQTDIIRSNASIDVLQANMIVINSSIDALQSNMINANASIDALQSNMINANASIDILQSNVININASIAHYKEEFVPVEWGKNASLPPGAAENIDQSYQIGVVRKFAGITADEKLSFVLRAPNGIQSTTVQYSPHVIITATPPAGGQGVVFGLKGHSKALGASYGTEVLASKIGMTATLNPRYSQVQVGWSSAVTLASLEGGRLAFFEFARKQSHTDDDYSPDVGVPGFDIQWI